MSKKIWIDLDNAPHVPFFAPIIRELELRSHSVVVTARDRFRVRELATIHNIPHVMIGKNYGKNKLIKGLGLCCRALQLGPFVLREKPDLALSHGSRSQILLSRLLRTPSLVITDYEHAKAGPLVVADYVIMPEIIPSEAVTFECKHIGKYPGIKEDVYVPGFHPEAGILEEMGIDGRKILVTVRPPASEAHYHVKEGDDLFQDIVEFISASPETVIILISRNEKMETAARDTWPELVKSGKLVIPNKAVDGLNLIWHSDLVISGGGTMIREAAALGVPAYSIFRGEIGAVDAYLARSGRLTMLESANDFAKKINLVKWQRPNKPENDSQPALQYIVDDIESCLGRS